MLFIPAALAQTSATATLRGQVTDPSGAVVPQATVTATPAAGPASTTTSNGRGSFELKGLAPGKYTVVITAKGFSTFSQLDVTLAAGQVETLNAPLEIEVQKEKVEVEEQAMGVNVSPENNAGAVVIKGRDLEALSDDPDELQSDLQALAGPSAGPNGGQIYIDGFTGGTLPPKASIREIRINQNPFSAQFDRVGFGRIEILTKPGTDKLHGQVNMNFNNAVLNAKNPYGPALQPGYGSERWGANVGGALSKKASFFVSSEGRNINDASLVHALVLDPSLNQVTEDLAVQNPQVRNEFSPRIDYQLTATNTLTARYQYEGGHDSNTGIGGFILPSQATNGTNSSHEVQISDTQILGPAVVNETRFRFSRDLNTSTAQNLAGAPTIQVPQAFTDGGARSGKSQNTQRRYELQNYTSMQRGRHFLRLGGRLRTVSLDNSSTGNYNGTFNFPSLTAYQITVQGLAQGLTAAQIRAAGGGANQFTLASGIPLASVSQVDAGFYAEDDFKWRPNLTLSYGLRAETQDNIRDHFDPAPRIGVSWGIGRAKSTPKTVLRAGYGMFYDRFSENQVLQVIRLDGVHQQQFVVTNPDFFPTVPTTAQLASAQLNSTVYKIAPHLRAPYTSQVAISLERQLSKSANLTLIYLNSRGLHQLYSDNINAPLPGTFNPAVPNSGVRPLGNTGNIYQYTSEGVFKQSQFIVNGNARLGSKVSIFSNYALGFANGNTSGAGSFPVNQYSLAQEYGRTGYDVRHRLTLVGTFSLPYAVRLNPFIVATSGRPYNITAGQDLNGDSIINDRPAFATAAACCAFNDFKVPAAGDKIIPLNLGTVPRQISINLRVSKAIGFGKVTEGPAAGNRGQRGGQGGPGGGVGGAIAGGGGRGPGGGGDGGRGPGGGGDRGGGPGGFGGGFGGGANNHRYTVTLSANARNLFNNVNLSAPVSNLSAGPQRFGSFVALAPNFGGPGGGGPGGGVPPAYNRRVDFQVQFGF